jgi:mannose-1-phosphate guanylyltransferase/mannose-6-phosphate isomerase
VTLKNPVVVTNETQRFLAKDQICNLNKKPEIILEQSMKNTAPALTLAAIEIINRLNDEECILIVAPSDHYVENLEQFNASIGIAINRAKENKIVTLGIKPLSPETGYGYIKFNQTKSKNWFAVSQFVEKPSKEKSVNYVNSGNYFWNSGMFILKAKLWLDALEKINNEMFTSAQECWKSKMKDDAFIRFNKDKFDSMPSDSIDYAVMEKLIDNGFFVEMVQLDAGWDDLGSWKSVKKYHSSDNYKNRTKGDIHLISSKNNFIHSSSNRLITGIGLQDMSVIDTPDALMIVNSDDTQNVKKLVSELKQSQRKETSINRKTYRPWGWYDNIEEGPLFKVKRIGVYPGAVLSLQKHHRRSEHWVVIEGIAEVTCGEKIFDLKKNESTYIPLGEIHRLRNNTENSLEIIEVQLGDYLEEDDIVRYEDTYGRTSDD